MRIRGEEDEVGEHMPIKHDFLRAKAAQEDFGGNERRTPYRDDGDGDDITADLALHGSRSGIALSPGTRPRAGRSRLVRRVTV